MRKFNDENFILQNETAKTLYFNYAKDMPIIDYHCHLNPKEIAENKKYDNITELWLGGDHYKWRNQEQWCRRKIYHRNIRSKGKVHEICRNDAILVGNPLYH